MSKVKVTDVKRTRIKYLQDDPIPNLNTKWQVDDETAYPGKRIEEFIKKQFGDIETKFGKKYGAWCVSPTVDASNFYHIWFFATDDDKTAYLADPEGNASLRLSDEVIPISTVQGDSFGSYLFSDVLSTTNYVVSGGSFKIKLRFSSVRTSNGERLNMGARGGLVIQRKTGNGEWMTVDTRTEALSSMDYSNTTAFEEVEIGNCLISGKQQIRIRAFFYYNADDGTQKMATSTYVVVGASITKTTLDITCQQNWQTPILASTYSSRGFPISYMVYGAVEKTLHVEITGGNNQVLSAEYALTADQDSATISKNIVDSTDAYKLFKHGVRTVKAWLTADDGKGGTISSKVLVNRFMVVNPTTDADKTTPYLLLQNVIDKADNYAQADICQYAVFSPGSNGTTNDGKAVSVIFYLTAYAENFPDGNPTQYFRIEQNVQPGIQNTLNTTIEIESESDSKTTIPAYFRIWRKDGDHEVNFMKDSISQSNLVIQVDNSESYAPKTGADFVLNPKTRNNSETNPLTIINAKTGKEIESTWEGFGLVRDGWLQSDVDGQRVLRVPAGAKLNFKYNPFAQFLTTADSALEIELDFMMRNVTNETDPIISLFENLVTSDASGNQTTTFRGLKMCPMHGEIHTKSNAVSSETDFNWREGVRTHIAINIHNAVATNKGDGLVPNSTTLDTTATKIALVRVFINGGIEREFKYSITDTKEFCTDAMSNGGFTIGHDGADIDIYSIRVYQNNALESSDVLNNYISTLPTTAEKKEVRKRNAILTGGKVDLQKCRELGMRCLVLHGVEPYKENTSKQKGYLEIFQYDKEGNYLPEYSGTLCKETASLVFTRQGSTANTYFYSNLQTKMQDVKETITVPLSQLHSSITYEVHDVTQEDGTIKKMVSLCGGNLGKGFPVNEKAVDYEYTTKDGADAVIVPDGWVDGNGKYRGVGYIVAEGTPMGQKLVNKINYASSMQSHLTGANNLYNDLHRIIVGKNAMQEACETARVSKYTEPFLFFTQALDSDTPVFRGPCTFGAGKMDKVAAGYDKKTYPNFTLLEGSDNNYELTDMRVPFTWNCPDCSENITYSAEDEGFFYNGKQCIDFDAGATDDNEVPKEDIIKLLQNAWNFLYLHSPMVSYYKGTFDAFQASDEAKNVFNKVWCTDGDDAYKLKRYDFVDKKWVDAGLWDDTAKRWKVIDIRTDEITKDTYEASSNQSEYAALNIEIRGAIVAQAKKYLGWYFKTDSLKLYYTFIIHLLAGTDSCSKNTYFAIDPKKVSVTIDGVTKECYLFEMWTDDVDTLLPIDNNGRSTKAYYIDRMHPYIDGDSTTEKYEGMHNILFNLCEDMWEGTKELQDMLKRIFNAMESLVSEKDYIEGIPSNVPKVSVYGCLWKYIYYVHKYFPQTAYNEAARIRYEYPEMLGFVSYGSGARGVRPITQSNGSLLECELQFIERRLILMASYAAWGPFADGKSGNLGIADATESFSMQAFHLPDSATSTNDYSFEVTPHQYIYPTGMLGQTVVDPHVRVAPGQKFKLDLGSTTSNDTGMSVSGINYYRSIGNLGDLSTTPANTITVNGKRLTEFVAEPTKTYTDSETGAATPAFRPGAIVVSAKNIKHFSIKGLRTLNGNINLQQCPRLIDVNTEQTNVSTVALPETMTLESVKLSDTITSISLPNQGHLKELTAEGYSNIESMSFGKNTPDDAVVPFVTLCASSATQDMNIELDNVEWDVSFVMSVLLWMIKKTFKGTGRVTVSSQLTPASVQNVSDILGVECFYDDAPFYVKTGGGNFLTGPQSVISGGTADYQMIVIPRSDYTPVYSLQDYESTTKTDGDTIYNKGVAHINGRTGHLTTDESINDVAVKVQGYYSKDGHNDMDVNIGKTTYPQEIRSIQGAEAITKTGEYTYKAQLMPVVYTGKVDVVWDIVSGTTDGMTLVSNGNECTLKVTGSVPVNFNKLVLRATATCGNGSSFTKQKDVFYSQEQPVITTSSNAAVMAVCYKQGWAANANYMLRSECEAVEDLGTAFAGNLLLQHFLELQYFTGLKKIADGAFKGCSQLADFTLPQTVTEIGKDAFNGCAALTSLVIPYVVIIDDGAFKGCSNISTFETGDTLTTIGTEILSDAQITELSFGPNVATIALDAFDNCQKLTKVTVSSSRFLTWGMAFKNCQSLAEYAVRNDGTTILKAENTILYRTDEQTIVAVPQACTTFTTTGYKIADYAFYWNVKSIGQTVINPSTYAAILTQENVDSLKSALNDYVADCKCYVFNSKGTKMAEIKSATFEGTYDTMTKGTVTFKDGTTVDISTLNDAGCNFMVYRPAMHIKSFTDDAGREILQQRGNIPIDGGITFREKFIGMFKGYVQNNVLKSQPGRICDGNRNIATYQALANAGGRGYTQWSYKDWCKENALHLSWFGNTNYEVNIGTGRINNYNNVRNSVTGFTLPMIGTDELYGTRPCVDSAGNAINALNFFHIEGLGELIWEFVIGYRHDESTIYIWDDDTWSESHNADYTVPYSINNASGSYIRQMVAGEHFDMIPRLVGGSSTTGYCDGYWASTGGRLLYVGGHANAGSLCGLSASISDNGFGAANGPIGARLAFSGRPVEVEGSKLLE